MNQSSMVYQAGRRYGFTLIEVMLALVLSLLVLVAAARAFKSIGDRINQSQSEVELSVALRDLSSRLVRDLESIETVPVIEPNNGVGSNPFVAKDKGYLVYHEGPMTNETTAHVNVGLLGETTASRTDYFEHSRYGDLDDYLAFTALADPKAPFTGYIPYGVLAAKRYLELKTGRFGGGDPSAFIVGPDGGPYDASAAATMVPFYSTQAEIAYWVSPVWKRHSAATGTTRDVLEGTLDFIHDDSATNPLLDGSGHPTFRDFEGDAAELIDADGNGDFIDDSDGLPDRCSLRRRVLLIRPDLNERISIIITNSIASIPPLAPVAADPPTLPFLIPGGTNHVLVPLSYVENGSGLSAATGLVTPGVKHDLPGVWWSDNGRIGLDETVGNLAAETTASFLEEVSPNWLTGIARLQQVMDLSVARVTNNWHNPSPTLLNTGTNYGMPSRLVQANSLEDLSQPHNRFAHVRIPRRLLDPSGVSDAAGGVLLSVPNARASTLPVLALTAPMPFLVAAEQNGTAASAGAPHRYLPSVADPDGASNGNDDAAGQTTTERYGRFTMNGFLRPEFNLSDRFASMTIDNSGAVQGDIAAGIVNLPRAGTDVVANRLLAFDVQIYDDNGIDVGWFGPDGQPGNSAAAPTGADDDGDGIDNDDEELGWPNSDDEVLQLSDLSIQRSLLTSANFRRQPNGGFVDLNFFLLSGHPLGTPWNAAATTGITGLRLQLDPYSGLGTDPSNDAVFNISAAIQQSGTVIVREQNGADSSLNSFLQSNYDTHTTRYQGDGFDQEGNGELQAGPIYPQPYATRGMSFAAKDALATPSNRPIASRLWSPANGTSRTYANVTTELTSGGLPVFGMPGDALHISAPVQRPLQAIQIQIRVIDDTTGQIQQRTIVHAFGQR